MCETNNMILFAIVEKKILNLKKLNFHNIVNNLNNKYKFFSFIWIKNDSIIFIRS